MSVMDLTTLEGRHTLENQSPDRDFLLSSEHFPVRPLGCVLAVGTTASLDGPRARTDSKWATEPADANGISLTQSPVSGRTTAIVIDPSDANIAYVGTAQGGLYRTLDGGSTWTPLLDHALALAVGSVVFDPADTTHNTLLVGTGESNFSGDSYAGVGVYKITSATPVA